jgi:hypothetical protein
MKLLFKIFALGAFFSTSSAFSATKEGISVDKIEVYSDKTKISDLGANGASIPSSTKIIVVRTNNPTYAGWKFVSYGNAANESLSILLTAKAMNKTVSCVWEDRGNYWVECVGLIVE